MAVAQLRLWTGLRHNDRLLGIFLISIWIVRSSFGTAAAIVKHKSSSNGVEANIAMQKDEDILEITESDDDSVGKR